MAKPNRSRKAAAKPAAPKPAPKPAAKPAAKAPKAKAKAAPKPAAKAKPKSSKSTVLPLEKGLDAAQRKLAIQQRKIADRQIRDLEAARADVNIQKEARKLFRLEQLREEKRLARVLAEQWRLEMAEAGDNDSPGGSDALHASISDAARKAVASRDQHKEELLQRKAQLDAEKAAQMNNFQQQQQAQKQGGKK